jgi:hypothetical protein
MESFVEDPAARPIADPQSRGSVLALLADILVHLRFKASVRRVAGKEQPIGRVLAPAANGRDLHQFRIRELDAVPPLLTRDGDPGDRRRVAIEPVDRRDVVQILDFSAEAGSLVVETAGSEGVDVAIDLAPHAFVRRPLLFEPALIG